MHAHHPTRREVGPTFTGRHVLDALGVPIGSVIDVVYDRRGVEPEYLIVDPGILRSPRYVPVSGSYDTIDGEIVVAWDKHWIKVAPKADGEHTLTSIDRRLLDVHYARR
jgi:hypothetical protein